MYFQAHLAHLAPWLAFDHVSPTHRGPEYQCEVGLLSRDIVFQGAPSTEDSMQGPHVRIQGSARISAVQAFRMGQRNVQGAYPFHWHLVGNAASPNNFITDSSVYRCAALAYVIGVCVLCAGHFVGQPCLC